LKLSRGSIAAGNKLNLISLEQLDDERFVLVMRVGQETGEEPRAKVG
jgi:hypothetical protein